jgi:hypothetical protein
MMKFSEDFMKTTIEAVETLRNDGVMFVPMPVMDEIDMMALLACLAERLAKIATERGEFAGCVQ